MVTLLKQPDTQVRAKETIISPSVAASWLEKMAPNRKVSPRAVERYAADMRAGRWQSNGSSIVMGRSGKILDGQHRLAAIVQANIPVSMMVVSGVDDAAFSTIDTGRARTTSDVLAAMGYPNTNILAATARMWLVYQDTGTFHNGPTAISMQEVLAVAISKFDAFHAAINATAPAMKTLRGSSGVWAVCWMTLGDIDPVDRDNFFTGVTTGADLSNTSPIFALRRALIERISSKHGRMGPLQPNILGAYILKAWNKYRAHESYARMFWRADEAFPEPI